MSKQLLILRHGKSDWTINVDDFHRPLKKRGIKAAKKIGYWLANSRSSKPDLVISSPAERALATARIAAEIAGIKKIRTDERIYAASLEDLLAILAELPEQVCCPMIVGHNPGLEELLLYLADVPKHFFKEWKLLTTGTLAIVKIQSAWNQLEENSGKFKHLIRGRDL